MQRFRCCRAAVVAVIAIFAMTMTSICAADGGASSSDEAAAELARRFDGHWHVAWVPDMTACRRRGTTARKADAMPLNGSLRFNATARAGGMTLLEVGSPGAPVLDMAVRVDSVKTGEGLRKNAARVLFLPFNTEEADASAHGAANVGNDEDSDDVDIDDALAALRFKLAIKEPTSVGRDIAISHGELLAPNGRRLHALATVLFFGTEKISITIGSPLGAHGACNTKLERVLLTRQPASMSFWDKHWTMLLFIVGFTFFKGWNGYRQASQQMHQQRSQ